MHRLKTKVRVQVIQHNVNLWTVFLNNTLTRELNVLRFPCVSVSVKKNIHSAGLPYSTLKHSALKYTSNIQYLMYTFLNVFLIFLSMKYAFYAPKYVCFSTSNGVRSQRDLVWAASPFLFKATQFISHAVAAPHLTRLRRRAVPPQILMKQTEGESERCGRREPAMGAEIKFG